MVKTPGVQREFLGFDVQLYFVFAVEMIMTKDSWHCRRPASIGTKFRRTSLFLSRAANIRKYVWPLGRREQQLVELEDISRRIYVNF